MSDKDIRNAVVGVLTLYLVALVTMEWVVITDPAFDLNPLFMNVALTLMMAPIMALGPCVPVVGILAAVDWVKRSRNVPRETSTEETS